MIDTDHAALLRAVAKNLKDEGVQKAYSDFLQERGSPGWLIVVSYPIFDWPVWAGENPRPHGWYARRVGKEIWENWRLPWLEGRWVFDKWVPQPASRVKRILNAYADGRVEGD